MLNCVSIMCVSKVVSLLWGIKKDFSTWGPLVTSPMVTLHLCLTATLLWQTRCVCTYSKSLYSANVSKSLLLLQNVQECSNFSPTLAMCTVEVTNCALDCYILALWFLLQTLFDLASLTKVLATTTAAMILYQRGHLNLGIVCRLSFRRLHWS